jgi:hypothetical protein
MTWKFMLRTQGRWIRRIKRPERIWIRLWKDKILKLRRSKHMRVMKVRGAMIVMLSWEKLLQGHQKIIKKPKKKENKNKNNWN